MERKVAHLELDQHWWIPFSNQLAWVAVSYDLDTHKDDEFESCLQVFLGLAKCN